MLGECQTCSVYFSTYSIQSVVLGGAGNFAGGKFSAIPGGTQNLAQGTASIAMGQRAKAPHPNSVVLIFRGTNSLSNQRLLGSS